MGNTRCWWRVGAAVCLVQPGAMLGDVAPLPDPAMWLSGLLAAVPHSAWTVLSWAPKGEGRRPEGVWLCEAWVQSWQCLSPLLLTCRCPDG